jgi:glutamate-ammonia-ligase adenylyltransferase
MARPTADELRAINPALASLAADSGPSPEECLARLPPRYFDEFDTPVVAEHVFWLCTLSVEKPFHVRVEPLEGSPERVAITVVSFDVEGMLGLLTGILGSSRFDIQTGSVYTFTRDAAAATRGAARRPSRRMPAGPVIPRRRIVDRFVGNAPVGSGTPEDAADELPALTRALEQSLGSVLPLMLPGGDREKARRMVNEAVADQLRRDEGAAGGGLYPVNLNFETPPDGPTIMSILSEDTPFFLYSLATALSLQGVSIEGVRINTSANLIRDELELADRSGSPIRDAARLDQIRLSVLLTKQFTYFLGQAPDPYAALVRFESLSDSIIRETAGRGLTSMLSEPLVLQELARLLGASDYLWEDFIRRQYENILPMLDQASGGFSTPSGDVDARLQKLLAGAPEGTEKRRLLNEFKDTENFRIDLDHILQRERDFFFLSTKLTELAEAIVRGALVIAWDEATARYGTPRTVAGLPAQYAVFGLGKLGGRALGYASDLELLFVYSDNGTTDGAEQISNTEFFERFFTETTGCIETKREGIFQVDLRLRPYGKAGPNAVSLESFIRYYGREGDAHSYEKLALTRLRFVAGDEALGHRVESLRDDLVYGTDSIDLTQLSELREKQLAEKAAGERYNAKFTPGGLVDLEYGLQILLVQHGRINEKLRTPSLHAALEELSRSGLMDEEEAARLVRSYRFLRNLINGLRMLRGNAQDLFLPDVESLEYAHLARRAGYTQEGELSPAQQLHIEFQARTAAVRAFLEHHLGREAIPGDPDGTAADLVLSADLRPEIAARITSSAGLRDARRAQVNIRSLAGNGEQRDLFSELVVLAWPSLRECSDPDMALNNWDRYVTAVADPLAHYRSLLRQPAKLGLMLQVFSSSQFLAETLIRTPAFLEWSLDRSVVGGERNTEAMLTDLENELRDDEDRRAVLRLFRTRELLRIGTRDMCLRIPIRTVTEELSSLAVAIVRADLAAVWQQLDAPQEVRDRFCILAFGKLGGAELNYSSDIDLLGVFDDEGAPTDSARLYASALEMLRADLSAHTRDGHAFRLDFRLRPYGSSGPLVQGLAGVERYYRESAAPWEHQALIKLNPIAGNLEVGLRLLAEIKPHSIHRWDARTVRESIERLRAEAVQQSLRRGEDIKSGEGGIRDIEFTVQGLQMIHAASHPAILTGNTFAAIELLKSAGLLDEETADSLRRDYELLRRVEHFLQVFEDRQVHSLPEDPGAREALARRLEIAGVEGDDVLQVIAETRARVRRHYEAFLSSGYSPDSNRRMISGNS